MPTSYWNPKQEWNTAGAVNALLCYILIYGSLATHLRLSYLAFHNGGVTGFATLLLPVISEAVWFVRLWAVFGFWNWLTICLLILCCCALLILLMVALPIDIVSRGFVRRNIKSQEIMYKFSKDTSFTESED